jgi:hypothetical protein
MMTKENNASRDTVYEMAKHDVQVALKCEQYMFFDGGSGLERTLAGLKHRKTVLDQNHDH